MNCKLNYNSPEILVKYVSERNVLCASVDGFTDFDDSWYDGAEGERHYE